MKFPPADMQITTADRNPHLDELFVPTCFFPHSATTVLGLFEQLFRLHPHSKSHELRISFIRNTLQQWREHFHTLIILKQ
jgi:hypothetical protein